MRKEDRIIQYDFIRIVAMLSVVLMHIMAHVSAEQYGLKWWIKTSIVLLASTCNGLFFMLSGKFSLNEKSSNDPLRFYRKRTVAVLIPFIICSLICFVAEKALIGSGSTYLDSFITVYPKTHYWFVYEMVGLIFWTPFFAVMMERLSLNKKLILSAVVLSFQFIFVLLKDLGIYPGYEFPLMGWPLFYLAGSFANVVDDRWKKKLIIIGIACFVLSLLQMRFLPDASLGLQDMSPKYFLLVISVYYIMQRILVPAWTEGIILFLARYSYYVYLFHSTVILLFFSEKLGIYDALIRKTGTPLFLIIVAGTSIAVSLVMGMVIKKAIDMLTK